MDVGSPAIYVPQLAQATVTAPLQDELCDVRRQRGVEAQNVAANCTARWG